MEKGGKADLFNQLKGEQILFESKPLSRLFWHNAIQGMIIFVLPILFFLALVHFLFVNSEGASIAFWAVWTPVFLLVPLLAALVFALARRAYHMRYYWLTNERVAVRRGLIGYTVTSIPLERISDALISRSFFERLFGFGSLHMQSIGGEYKSVSTFGAEGNLEAMPDPEKNQELIFRLVKEKRKRERLTM